MHGNATVMVATGAFGTGIDVRSVRLVIHVDEPYSIIDLAQESGRAGRDGLPAKHIVVVSMAWRPRQEACAVLKEFIGGSRCRRLVLQEYVDGSGLDCFTSGSSKCDVCELFTCDIQSSSSTRILGTPEPCWNVDDIDVFANMGEDTLAILDSPPSKRIRIGDAVLWKSAEETREQHASLKIASLEFRRFLEETKDKCVICATNRQHRGCHGITQCPYMKHLCFRCLARDHGYNSCKIRLEWKKSQTQCFGCGLPKRLGQQHLHPEKFKAGCNSIGDDKVIPACWFFWRNSQRYRALLERCGFPLEMTADYDFAKWLTSENASYVSNAVHLVVLYVSVMDS